MNLKQVGKQLDSIIYKVLGEFEEKFMVGLITGVMVISMILYRSFGLGFSFSASGQLHLISVNFIFFLIPLSYYLLRFESNNGKRVFASLCFAIFVFSLHDVAWLIETHWVPPVFQIPIPELDLKQYIYHYSKNAMNILISSVGIIKFFHISKKFLLAFGIQCLFHVVNIVYKIDGYILNPYMLIIMYLFDCIPYLLLIRRKTPLVK